MGGAKNVLPCLFFLNNYEMAKAVTLVFCIIQLHFIGNIRVKFSIHNFPQPPDIWKNSNAGISDFRISGQFLIIKNCHNYRISGCQDMKLGPVIKIDKKKKTTSKKIDDDVMLINCDAIVICPAYSHVGAIQKPDSGLIDLHVHKTYMFINSRHFSHVTKSRISKNLNLRKKADRSFCGNFLKNHFRDLKLYSNPPGLLVRSRCHMGTC